MDFTISQIIAAVIVSLVGGGGVVKLLGFGIAQLNLIRDKRKAAQLKQIADGVETIRIIAEDKRLHDDAAKVEIWKLYNEARLTIKELEAEARSSNSLSRPTLTKMYAHLRQAQRLISHLEDLVAEEAPHSDIAKKVEKLRAEVDQMEKDLP